MRPRRQAAAMSGPSEEGLVHQQIRTKLGKASSVETGGGAMNLVPIEVDPLEIRRGALVELLQLLEDNGYDLAMVYGDGIELGGEVTFAIKEHERTTQCAALLKEKEYREVRILRVRDIEVDDEVGGLRREIEKITAQNLRIDEIYVGATLRSGKVPVQITTVREVD
jgi:hypothetical protein